MSALLEYECRVSVGGYDVITIEDPSWPGKKIRVLHPRSKRTRRFDLFEFNSSAFLEFAQTPLTEDGVKDFADRYGLLSNALNASNEWESGGDISLWFANIRAMRRTVELWQKSTVTGDFSRIIREVRRSSYINWKPSGGPPVALFLKIDRLSASPKLCFRPFTFQEALWAQLAWKIDGDRSLLSCAHCRKWFTLEAGRGRSDKEYCSNACRMRAYRERKGSG